jgi:hypothetical protein
MADFGSRISREINLDSNLFGVKSLFDLSTKVNLARVTRAWALERQTKIRTNYAELGDLEQCRAKTILEFTANTTMPRLRS